MATATMGLRRRVQVSGAASSSSPSKRTRSENNNSPSQGNLNSLEPAAKKSRSSSTRSATRAKELELAKSKGPPHWADPRPYASIAGLSLNAQAALCSEGVTLPSPIAYMSSQMATFVGNAAASLGKGPSMSYLDISNMTGMAGMAGMGGLGGRGAGGPAAWAEEAKGLPFLQPFAGASKARGSPQPSEGAPAPASASSPQAQISLPKVFPNDAMFATYQPWVIKTYGDLAKTKTITIKKYARILRTLRGEEVNSAENSKFRFWVKSKGFHIGQPDGYEAKPADRIIGRHAVSNPGLDPPLYVPTQSPSNKGLNGAEGTVSSGRVYKKVAIVENFFDIIHAVHVDLEGRPGKHAGQKRTYRTITETYAFLPREAVTRFLLGCTECQRRPRTPSPTSLSSAKPGTPSPPPTPASPPITVTEKPSSPKPAAAAAAPTHSEAPARSPQPERPERPQEASDPSPANSPAAEQQPPEPSVPAPLVSAASAAPAAPAVPAVTEAGSPKRSSPPVTPTPVRATTPTTTSGTSAPSTVTSVTTTTVASAPSAQPDAPRPKVRDEKYNPLSITNLLRKDPPVTRRPPLAWSPVEGRPFLPLDYAIPVYEPPSVRQLQACPDGKSTASSASESDSDVEEERRSPPADGGFSPAAGLIDTNLNLLATIQQLHCQVMMALTERLRPPTTPSPGAGATAAPDLGGADS